MSRAEIAGAPGVRWAVVLLLALSVWRAACRPSPADPRRGILIYQVDVPGERLQLHWLDLATGVNGRLGYDGSSPLSFIDDRRAVWMKTPAETWPEYSGVVRVTRGDGGMATHAIADVSIASVSPDGAHALMAPRFPARPNDELHFAHFTGTRFEPDQRLGVPFEKTHVHGWFDTRTALVSRDDDVLLRVTPGKRPTRVRSMPGAHDGVASHDMTLFAWTTASADDRWVLHIASLRDARAKERTVVLEKGFIALCMFAPGDRTLGCEVAQAMPLGLHSMLIDTETGRRTDLDEIDPFVFSPDGNYIATRDPELTLVPVDGKSAPIALGRRGFPVAWIR